MKITFTKYFLVAIAISIGFLLNAQESLLKSASVKNIILDTDMSGDCDDAGAVAILHIMADNGEVNILGMASCTLDPYSAPTIQAVNTYYGRPNIPVGTLKEAGAPTSSLYTKHVAQNFPNTMQNGSNAPDATVLYRQILAQQPDHSVTFVAVGPMRNMRDLLQSAPDAISPLNGRDLIAAKVVEMVTMGGDYPTGNEWNFKEAGAGASYAITNWPTAIMFSGASVGGGCMTGYNLDTRTPATNPVRAAYSVYLSSIGRGSGRDSWDPSAVLYAVRGLGTYFTAVTGGKAIVAANGSNTWQDGAGNMSYLKKVDNECISISTTIDDLMYTPPASACTVAVTGVSLSSKKESLFIDNLLPLTLSFQ